MSNLLISPHCDDESLFCAFTLCREAADIQVVVVFDGHIQAARGEAVTWPERRAETERALWELGVKKDPIFLGYSDNAVSLLAIDNHMGHLSTTLKPGDTVYFPWQEPGGHEQHNLIGSICESNFGRWEGVLMKHYLTYTRHGKSTGGKEVIPEPDWIILKLRALACYKSQITVANCREHFMRGLHEYYA